MKFPMTIQLYPFVSKDAYGDYTYGTPTAVPAVVDYLTVNHQTDKIIESSAWIALPPTTTISINDKIGLSNGSTTYIGSISPIYNNRTGLVHYIEVYDSKTAPGGG